MTLAYVGLGSNLGDRAASIARAAELIGAARVSAVIETEPWGERYFQVADPNGVVIQLVQWVTPPRSS